MLRHTLFDGMGPSRAATVRERTIGNRRGSLPHGSFALRRSDSDLPVRPLGPDPSVASLRYVARDSGLYLRKIPERISARPRPIPRKAPP